MIIGFRQVECGALGLPTTENHLNFEWMNPACRVLFSVCRQGKSASIHFASNREGLRHVEVAVNSFCKFIFMIYGWCTMILAKIGKSSVERMAIKCGFSLIARKGEGSAWVRCR